MTTIPPPERRPGIADLLRLLDRSLDDADAMRRLRDALADHDQQGGEGTL